MIDKPVSDFEREFEQEFEMDDEVNNTDTMSSEMYDDNESDEESDKQSDEEYNYEVEDEFEVDDEFENDEELTSDSESDSDDEFEIDEEVENDYAGWARPGNYDRDREFETRIYRAIRSNADNELQTELELDNVLHEMEQDYFFGAAKSWLKKELRDLENMRFQDTEH